MHPTEFDKALRDRYESGSLPPDLAQWEQLARRLDVHAAGALPPARKPRRGIVALWPVWTAAASALLVGWLFLQRSEPGPIAKKTQTVHQATAPAVVSRNTPDGPGTGLQPDLAQPSQTGPVAAALPPAARTPGPASAAGSASRALSPAVAAQAPAIAPAPVATLQPEAHTESPAAAQQTVSEPRRAVVNLASRDAQIGVAMTDGYDPEEREQRRVGVDLNGGYGPGSLKRNYAFGVSLNRNVTERIKVEAGVAVVSGTYESFSASAMTSSRTNLAAVPENTNNRLTYIQAAPAVTYEIRTGLYAGAGVDAQRLLSNADEARGYEYADAQIETQPTWDFGYTVRAGYKLNRNIKAGLQYRNSMHVTAPIEGSSVQPRNYLLFQLGYTIH